VVIAQRYGARDPEGLSRTVHTAIALALAAGVGITVLGVSASGPALRLMGTPADVLPHATVYLRVYFAGSIASFLYNMGSSILRAVGDTKRPLYFLIAACLTNIVLDLLFVVVLDLGVLGVGLATVLSQVVSAALVLFVLLQPACVYTLVPKEVRFYPGTLKNILRIGVPAGIQSDMYAVSNILLQSCINAFGTDTVAAYTAFGKVDGFYWMISGAFGVAITTFVSQNFGAQKYDRLRRSVRVCWGSPSASPPSSVWRFLPQPLAAAHVLRRHTPLSPWAWGCSASSAPSTVPSSVSRSFPAPSGAPATPCPHAAHLRRSLRAAGAVGLPDPAPLPLHGYRAGELSRQLGGHLLLYILYYSRAAGAPPHPGLRLYPRGMRAQTAKV
jgi:hypothetical protein